MSTRTMRPVPIRPGDYELLLSKVRVLPSGCWEWQGQINKQTNYGRIDIYRKSYLVHRWVYTLIHGAIPQGMILDHTCHDPEICPGKLDCPHRKCANPDHLEAVTDQENMERGKVQEARRMSMGLTCGNGHPRTPENTVVHTTKRGISRRCVPCQKLDQDRYFVKRKGEHIGYQKG